ncbi:DNA-binding MarR family transcriptional regulator [Stackebrandtia endophytica]|uniref:DNA-binding MarR family transcriptional regulator n=1 Tax=Stackebrandtia endophytica TaxID=1496996 RepID=A0A543AUL3_9ACTN|nr:MarR family transcriptional regulator [Stackebrandtia endophytica]TQL76278.1 DNA-binding MarR family transcriptional regulator [Stackebrandtia endophytica]
MTRRDSDDTDDLIEQWVNAVPDIDPRVEGAVDRILICARYLERLAQKLAGERGVQLPDYEILARLFWTGPPHRLRPSQLAAGTMSAATTVTSRLVRLEKRGLIRRVAEPGDRRALAAELTDDGRELFVSIVKRQAAAERELFADLPPEKLAALAELLSDTLVTFEGRLGPPPRRVRLALSQD